MATYTIIGGDSKQYPLVTAEDLRRWIAEGRLNTQSLVKAEGETEFRPLSTFPEFADALGLSPAPPPPLAAISAAGGDGGREAALKRVAAPAVALMITAILDLLFGVWGLLAAIFSSSNMQQYNARLQELNNPQLEQFIRMMLQTTHGTFAVASNLLGIALSVLILLGAIKLRSLRGYEFATTAAIVALLPCVTPCCLIGLPFGIWALVVLHSPAVKSQFH